jgi:hypothetical protein
MLFKAVISFSASPPLLVVLERPLKL